MGEKNKCYRDLLHDKIKKGMKYWKEYLLGCFLATLLSLPIPAQIVQKSDVTPLEKYAALELQRYYYQLSGRLLGIQSEEMPDRKSDFILTTLDSPLIGYLKKKGLFTIKETPGPQGYILHTIKNGGCRTLLIAGADPCGLLYGVYGLLEDHLGVRFYMSGDVLPEKKIQRRLPIINETRTPKMYIRGFLPWTNFPQSATIYSWNDWRYIIDQAAKMRMNFILIHNYNGFCNHNEMFHNFEYNGYLSRGWMPTIKTGHGWECPGWDINEYRFGASEIYDDYDFGADYGLHNETLTNSQIKEKGETIFRRVIEYAHQRGVKIGLGLDIDVILPEYQVSADERGVITAQTTQLAREYPGLDYLFCFQSESNKDSVFYAKWQRVFDGFYEDMKHLSPSTRIAVSGWGITAKSVASLPKDVICAPISHYSATFESGSIYGEREYWGCPWLERDWNSSQYYYPYNVNLSETIHSYEKAAVNMKGFYALTWRLTDAISPKLWYVSKAPWYKAEQLDTSEKVYQDFAASNYGQAVTRPITSIINQNEPFATDFAECQQTPSFNEIVKAYPLMNIQSLTFSGKQGELMRINAVDFQDKKGTKNAPSSEGGECVGYIMDGDWLKYNSLCFADHVSQISVRVASASNGGIIKIYANEPNGPLVASIDVKNTEGWQAWKTLTVPVKISKGVYSLHVGFQPFDKIAKAKDFADKQLNIIDSCIAVVTKPKQKQRLSYLRARIEAVKCHIMLNADFENYQWGDLPGEMDRWARSFLHRIDDISSFGNIMSTQNRFVKQNYVEKVNKMRKQQRVKAPSHIMAKGTAVGALVTWRNEEPGTAYFVVCRNGKEIASVPRETTRHLDNFNEKASYSVYAVDTDGNKSPLGIPASCWAGSADNEAPIIIIPSAVTSVAKGHRVDIKLSMVDNRLADALSATLHYRAMGSKIWKKIPFKHRVRAAFTVTIPAKEFSLQGIEYYITASDSRNVSVYPVDAPNSFHTIVVTETETDKISSPLVKAVAGNLLKWERVANADMYRIYRSTSSDFKPDASSFITFIGGKTTSFCDNGYDLNGVPLKGVYFYRVTAVSSEDTESIVSETIKIIY